MFSRRGILGLFGGLLSWFAAKKVVAEPVVELQTLDHVLPEGFIPLPDWCPEGWIPTMGQNISKEQFPALFEPVEFIRKNGTKGRYLPPFHGLEIAPLPFSPPRIPNDLEAWGWVDRLTYLPRKEKDNKVVVHGITTKPLVSSNGKVWQPGFSASIMVVDRETFEVFYGPIKECGGNKMYFEGHERFMPHTV